MKAIIFAGGVGTRLWPLSRKKSPKQFEKIIGDKSTLQLTVERLFPEFKPENIFISTGKSYIDIVAKQLPYLPRENIIGEPVKKDVGPAVAFVCSYIAKKYDKNEPIVILWSDHLVRAENKFRTILREAEKIIMREPNKIVFIGQKARFASDNLGWIQFGQKVEKNGSISFYRFEGFKYKPDKSLALKYFKDGKHCWNLGYFVTTPSFVRELFKRFSPQISDFAENIVKHSDKPDFDDIFTKRYKKMPTINFDNAILEQLNKEYAYVVVEDIGWSDVGAWEALKEALEEKRADNITSGKIFLESCSDSLIYNYEEGKLVVAIDLEDLLVVNTPDVLLVANKESVGKIKKVVEGFEGTEHESLT